MDDEVDPPPFLQSLASQLLVSFLPSINRLPTSSLQNPKTKKIKQDDAGETLPTDLLWFEILPRIPPNSLMRIRYVCKSWSTLPRNPTFLAAYKTFHHRNYTTTQSHLLLSTWEAATNEHHLFSLDVETPTATINHLLTLSSVKCDHYGARSINGLVCFHVSNYMARFMDGRDHLVRIFNPTTRECITLPASSSIYGTSYVTYHFGFNPVADEYKILQVRRLKTSLMYEIFTLGKSYWRPIEQENLDRLVPFNSFDCHFRTGGVYANGVMYWFTENNKILAFEFVEEKFRVMSLPQGIPPRLFYSRPKLVQVGGSMAVIGLHERGMELWVLKDYRNQVWEDESTTFAVKTPKRVEYHYPLGTIHSGEELLLCPPNDKVAKKMMVQFYNRKTNMFKGRQVEFLESMFPGHGCLQLLTIYEQGNIAPLRSHVGKVR